MVLLYRWSFDSFHYAVLYYAMDLVECVSRTCVEAAACYVWGSGSVADSHLENVWRARKGGVQRHFP